MSDINFDESKTPVKSEPEPRVDNNFFISEKEYDLKHADENITKIKKMLDRSSKQYEHIEKCRLFDDTKDENQDNPFDRARKLLEIVPKEKIASRLWWLKARIESSYYRDYLLGTREIRDNINQIFLEFSEIIDKVKN